jgi:hypothetical protein
MADTISVKNSELNESSGGDSTNRSVQANARAALLEMSTKAGKSVTPSQAVMPIIARLSRCRSVTRKLSLARSSHEAGTWPLPAHVP